MKRKKHSPRVIKLVGGPSTVTEASSYREVKFVRNPLNSIFLCSVLLVSPFHSP